MVRFLPFLSVLPMVLPFLSAQNPADFVVESELIRVSVTALDPQGRSLTGLNKEDFVLYEEGRIRPIEHFLPDPAPVHALVLLDVSSSLPEELERIRESALQFAAALDPGDSVALMSFSDRPVLLQNWTTSRARLRRALGKLDRGFRTALYDALLEAIREHPAPSPGRKVVLLVTDGLDNQSSVGESDALKQVIESDVGLYIVSRTRLLQERVVTSRRVHFLSDVMRNILGEEIDFVEMVFRERESFLERLAEGGGGRLFFPERLERLGPLYRQIVRELKSRYLLTFRPPPASARPLRTIRVECAPPCGTLVHRTRYRWRSPNRR